MQSIHRNAWAYAPVWSFLALALAMGVLMPGPAAAQPNPFVVKDISSFVFCLRQLQGPRSAADAIKRCMPPGCKITLTMSTRSAQAACTLGGCQLPRALFDCPDPTNKRNPKRFRPSFLFCPVDSTGGSNHFGLDRIEVGEDNENVDVTAGGNSRGNMNMADIPAGPNTDFTGLTVAQVESADGNDKRCNLCHAKPDPQTDGAGFLLSKPLDPFGRSQAGPPENLPAIDLGPFIIDTNDMRFMPPARGSVLMGKDAQGRPVVLKGTDGNPLTAQNLEDVCSCIRDPQKAQAIRAQANDPAIAVSIGMDRYDSEGNFSPKKGQPNGEKNRNPDPNNTLIPYLQDLCAAMLDYRTNLACGKADPDPTLACSGVNGGGKYVLNNGVSILRFGLSGSSNFTTSGVFTFNDIEGSMTAYNYGARVFVDSAALNSLEVSVSPGSRIAVMGTGPAFVSTPLTHSSNTNVILVAVQQPSGINASDCGLPPQFATTSGSTCFGLFNVDAGMTFLAGGIGEAGRAAVQFAPNAP